MSTLSTAPIGIPPINGLWTRIKSLWAKTPTAEPMVAPMESHGLPERVAELEAEVAVLQTQAAYAQDLLNQVQNQLSLVVSPHAVLPTDVYIAGRRYTEDGVAYITTAVSGTDVFLGGARITATGEQVVV